MRGYSKSYTETLALPLRVFWMLNRNLDRLRAEEDLRALPIIMAQHGGEAVKELQERLVEQLGTPVLVEKQLDEEKFLLLQKQFASERTPNSSTETE